MNDSKSKGGHARAEALTPERRAEIAQKAARARHEILKATHGAEEHPLRIGEVEIPCFVLEDGRRVLKQTGVISALNMSHGGSYSTGGDRLAKFAAQGRLKSFVSNELIDRTANPIRFRTPRGSIAYGYEATILADLCDAILAARSEGGLQKQQEHIAKQAEILVRGFARVGIIALVDEATGYQADRARDALARILEAFIAKELQPWIPTFPIDFYKEMFRLRGLDFPDGTVKRPQYFGMLTNDIVYRRIAPGVLDELKRVTPRNDEGRPRAKYFQSLTSNKGYPKLKEHLGAVTALMKISKDWNGFIKLLNQHYPAHGETMQLPFDDGKGI